MSKPVIILPQKYVYQTHVIHHNGVYMMSRTRNGFVDVHPLIVSEDAARRIVDEGNADPDGEVSTWFNPVEFPGRGEWSWLYQTTRGDIL